jgi:hypothetical protein
LRLDRRLLGQGAALGVALGGESLSVRMIIGGLAILSAMYLVELAPLRAAPVRSLEDSG